MKSLRTLLPMLNGLPSDKEEEAHPGYGQVFQHILQVLVRVEVCCRKQGVVPCRYSQKHP